MNRFDGAVFVRRDYRHDLKETTMNLKKIRLGLAAVLAASVLVTSTSFATSQGTSLRPTADFPKLCITIKHITICIGG
jgi:hypothetical protein